MWFSNLLPLKNSRKKSFISIIVCTCLNQFAILRSLLCKQLLSIWDFNILPRDRVRSSMEFQNENKDLIDQISRERRRSGQKRWNFIYESAKNGLLWEKLKLHTQYFSQHNDMSKIGFSQNSRNFLPQQNNTLLICDFCDRLLHDVHQKSWKI